MFASSSKSHVCVYIRNKESKQQRESETEIERNKTREFFRARESERHRERALLFGCLNNLKCMVAFNLLLRISRTLSEDFIYMYNTFIFLFLFFSLHLCSFFHHHLPITAMYSSYHHRLVE